MAKVVTDNKNYTDIANAIREKTGTGSKYKPSEMPTGVNEVYEVGRFAGYSDGETQGYNNGYNVGHADGIQSEYDRFWDAAQNNGSIMQYFYAFAGWTWDDSIYNPKYKIRMILSSRSTFYYSQITDTKVEMEIVDDGGTPALQGMFGGSTIKKIRKITFPQRIVLPSGTSSWFWEAKKLTDIEFGCNIYNSINFSYSPLSVSCMKHIISKLENYLGTDSEGLYTVKFTSACWTKLEADSTSPTGTTWKEYVTDYLGWLV